MQKQVIDASKRNFWLDFKELYQFRDLFFTLALRDFRVRYAQTFLGFLWAFLQPLATVLVLVLVFGKALKVDTGGIPYPLYAMAGIAVWSYFAFVLNQSGTSIISAQSIVTKIYFPKLIIPVSKAMVGFVDMLITFCMLLGLLVWYAHWPSSRIVYLPFFMLVLIFTSLGVGILFSALTVRFRDFQYVIPFIVQFGLYATPVAYPASFISQDFKFFYYLNPMAGLTEGFRWCLFNGLVFEKYALVSFISAFTIFAVGLFFFRATEDKMADIV